MIDALLHGPETTDSAHSLVRFARYKGSESTDGGEGSVIGVHPLPLVVETRARVAPPGSPCTYPKPYRVPRHICHQTYKPKSNTRST